MQYKKILDKKVICTACAHYCQISNGGFGICKTRQNQNGKLKSLVYGKVVALNIDPIEKKPLFHFLPKTKTLSFGTLGCNFRCSWCQNWQISQESKKAKIKNIDFSWGEKISPQDIVRLAEKKSVPSISYTYNEPAIFIEYAYNTAKLARSHGIKNILVSNGFWSKETFNYIKPYTDAANIDLKSFEEKFYSKYCGASLKPVLETITKLNKQGIHLELTTLIIPTLNDSEKNLKNIADFIVELNANIPWHISRFFPCYKLSDLFPTPISTLKKAQKIGLSAGLKNVYIGNV